MAENLNNNTENDEAEEVKEASVEVAEEIDEALTNVSDDNDENDDETAEAEKKEGKIVDDILEIIESTLITVFVVIMIFTYLLHPVTVSGPSMNNNLFSGDRLFMTTVYGGLHYGDIIIINNDFSYLLDDEGKVVKHNIDHSDYKECLIKRIIAEPGQTIDIDPEKEEVIVDGKVLNEPYIRQTINSMPFRAFDYPVTVPEGYYFVMGDNRRESADSRHPDIGLIKKDQIYGKALVRYAPVKDFKFLKFKEK
ncbi:MAG: signal peptidase I [Ruminococcus sp.]|uniref:signal peptidase I n=1 Tax=Ruminococcus sp. TaxID=41978 RepID=UPI0025F719C2|nr:signal peptidase I [Ruminococcus sp.]MBR5682212.1 signal peptidase I [Ruminococcus sp.]